MHISIHITKLYTIIIIQPSTLVVDLRKARQRGAKVVDLDLLGVDKGRVAAPLVDVGLAEQLHLGDELGAEDVEHGLDALLAKDVGEHGRAAEADGARAQGQQRQDVGAAAHAAVGVDLDLVEHLGVVGVEVEEDLDGGGGAVDDAAAVVGDVDGVEAEVGAQLDVAGRLDALGHDGQRRHVAQAVQRVDGEVEAVARVAAARAVAQRPIPDTANARVVDRQEDGLEPGCLDLCQLVLNPRRVGPEVLLVEHDLAVGGRGADRLDGLRRRDGRDVQDAGRRGGLDQVRLGAVVGVACVSGRGDEVGGREVVAQYGGAIDNKLAGE